MNQHEICDNLRQIQRFRAYNLKTRIMLENRLVASVASSLGYYPGLDKKERDKKFVEARKLIEKVDKEGYECEISPLIYSTLTASKGFDRIVKNTEKSMTKMVKSLKVAKWIEQKEQAGFGLKSLGVVIGETGDLSNYSNPAKVWKRMGLMPYYSEEHDKALMGSTWRSGKEGKLTKSQWDDFGYNPRRRSVMFIIGECLIKQNKSVYRARYDFSKKRAGEVHPEWIICSKCKGEGIKSGKKCISCKGTGEVYLRCHLHGMLLATKLLLKNLWCEWNPELVEDYKNELIKLGWSTKDLDEWKQTSLAI